MFWSTHLISFAKDLFMRLSAKIFELPHICFTEELSRICFTEELPRISFTEELPLICFTEELSHISFTEELPHISFTEELPHICFTEELPHICFTEELSNKIILTLTTLSIIDPPVNNQQPPTNIFFSTLCKIIALTIFLDLSSKFSKNSLSHQVGDELSSIFNI